MKHKCILFSPWLLKKPKRSPKGTIKEAESPPPPPRTHPHDLFDVLPQGPEQPQASFQAGACVS